MAPAGFSFGQTPASTQPSTGFSFGSLGTNTSTTQSAFTTPAGTGFTGFGGTGNTGFGLSTTTTGTSIFAKAGGTTSLFGSTPATTTTTSLFGTLGTNVTTAPALGLTSTAPSIFTSSAATVGLGGVDLKATSTLTGTSIIDNKSSDGKLVKATPIDAVVIQTVEAFKKHVKEEKSVQEEIMRGSVKGLMRVQEDIRAMQLLLTSVASEVRSNTTAVDRLKSETSQELKNAEMAHRTQNTPHGLQYENTLPTLYFQRLVESYDSQMQTYRKQIEVMESHLMSLHATSMSPQELVEFLKKLRETFIALAAQLHLVHEKVKSLKDQYLTYRRTFLSDNTNVFETKKPTPSTTKTVTFQVERHGPNPFATPPGKSVTEMAALLNRPQTTTGVPPAVGLSQQPSLGTSLFGASTNAGTGMFGASSTPALGGSLFGGNLNNSNTTLGTTGLFGTENKPFQLQKPPAGAKRGKR